MSKKVSAKRGKVAQKVNGTLPEGRPDKKTQKIIAARHRMMEQPRTILFNFGLFTG